MMERYLTPCDKPHSHMAESSSATDKVTAHVPEDWVDAIEAELDYGDHKSEWVREAIRRRLRDEGVMQPDDLRRSA